MGEQQNNKINKGLGELHQKEIGLIRRIREKYRFGEITIVTKDGLPIRIRKVVTYEGTSLDDDFST